MTCKEMAMFPSLKTGAVAQYPLTRRVTFQNQSLTFVDGTQQRYRDGAAVRLRWEIRLQDLDDGELAAVEELFLASQGTFGSFTFTDPEDGTRYENCSFESDRLDVISLEEMRGSTQLFVVQNR